MDAMDYDAHLFADAEAGEDAIVYRAGPTGLRLARQNRMHPSDALSTETLVVNSRPVPTDGNLGLIQPAVAGGAG